MTVDKKKKKKEEVTARIRTKRESSFRKAQLKCGGVEKKLDLGHIVKAKMLGLAEGLCNVTQGKVRVISGFGPKQLGELSAIY